MCRGGTSASRSARYLNGQLVTLWENAIECAEYGGDVEISAEDYDEYSTVLALAQFHFHGKRSPKTILSADDLLFEASFGCPELKFICNHEAVLCVAVQSGYFNLEYSKATLGEYQVDA